MPPQRLPTSKRPIVLAFPVAIHQEQAHFIGNRWVFSSAANSICCLWKYDSGIKLKRIAEVLRVLVHCKEWIQFPRKNSSTKRVLFKPGGECCRHVQTMSLPRQGGCIRDVGDWNPKTLFLFKDWRLNLGFSIQQANNLPVNYTPSPLSTVDFENPIKTLRIALSSLCSPYSSWTWDLASVSQGARITDLHHQARLVRHSVFDSYVVLITGPGGAGCNWHLLGTCYIMPCTNYYAYFVSNTHSQVRGNYQPLSCLAIVCSLNERSPSSHIVQLAGTSAKLWIQIIQF